MLYLDFSCQKSILCKSRSRFVYGTGSMHAGKGMLFFVFSANVCRMDFHREGFILVADLTDLGWANFDMQSVRAIVSLFQVTAYQFE